MSPAKNLNLIFLLFLGIACTNTLPVSEGSVLIIAVSGLNADDIGDGSSVDNLTPNIEKLVKESVRFTHAYTTSPLENAGFASLLTGLFPSEHGVRTNGATRFNKNVKSLSEILPTKEFMSFFISSGPPVFRKSAVSRGFNDFDDSFKPENEFFLPAKGLADKFLNTYENRIEHAKFFGILYFSDLLFPDTSTKDKRLQEIDNAIGLIRDKLDKDKKWDGLTVIFTSMRGNGRFESLYDEVMRVPLVIKPSRKHRDLAPSWKIDSAISFADVGKTLPGLLGLKPVQNSQFNTKDFSSSVLAKDMIRGERVIFMESELLKWRNWGPRIFAIRQGEWVLLPQEKKLFNTYTDRSQINNLYGRDKEATDNLEKIWQVNKNFLTADGFGEKNSEVFQKLNLAKVFFSNASLNSERKMAYDDYPSNKDWQVIQWYLKYLADKKSTKIGKVISKLKPETKSEKKELAMWKKIYGLANKTYVASDCESSIPVIKQSLEKYSLGFLKDCRDRETQAWLQAFLNFKAKRMKEAGALYDVAQAYTNKRKDLNELGKYFWLNNATWDLQTEYPDGLSVFEFFLSQVDQSEFENFVKKKPAL